MTLQIRWPKLDITVKAEPLEYNRALLEKFKEMTPFTTVQLHAMVTGEDLYAYTPKSIIGNTSLVEKKIRIHEMPVGYVAWSLLGLFAIYYGPCTEDLPSTPIAAIPPSDHERLIAAGRAVWNSIQLTKDLIIVEVTSK